MINTKRLRVIVGCLGMLLPILVLVLSLAYGFKFPDSISETYFVDTCIAPFMIILGAAGVLLLTYQGYTVVDDVLNTSAGICGLGVCLFPCAVAGRTLIGTFQLPVGTSNTIHTIAAVGFFGILAYNSLFQFTKGSENPTPNKKKRNVIFRVCGIGMFASFIALALAQFGVINIPHVTWVIETVALFFFGISWLTKADCIPFLFADKK
jgi:hypothetical protein